MYRFSIVMRVFLIPKPILQVIFYLGYWEYFTSAHVTIHYKPWCYVIRMCRFSFVIRVGFFIPKAILQVIFYLGGVHKLRLQDEVGRWLFKCQLMSTGLLLNDYKPRILGPTFLSVLLTVDIGQTTYLPPVNVDFFIFT